MSLDIQSSSLRASLVCGLSAATSLTTLTQGQASQQANSSAATGAILARNYGRIPLSFEVNQGQADKTAKFVSKGSGYSLYLTDSSAVLALSKPAVSSAKPGLAAGRGVKPASVEPVRKTDVVRMELAGANRATQVAGVDRLQGTANYFIGNDPTKWQAGCRRLPR